MIATLSAILLAIALPPAPSTPTLEKQPPKKIMLVREIRARGRALNAADQLLLDGRKAYSHKNFEGAYQRYQAALLKLKEIQILDPKRTFFERLHAYQDHFADSAHAVSIGQQNRLHTIIGALKFAPHSTHLHNLILYLRPSLSDYRTIYKSYFKGIKNFECFYENPRP